MLACVELRKLKCVEDALKAAELGVDAIVLSNHGGRQVDYARSGIEILEEVMSEFDRINCKMQVFVDGGIRRGSDIFKALALGASGVGVGRPTLYGLAAYGQAGVERVIDIFAEELRITMQLMGTPTIADIKRHHVDARALSHHITLVPEDHLHRATYEPLRPAGKSKL